MISAILFLVFLAALAFGYGWLSERPGRVSLEWQGQII